MTAGNAYIVAGTQDLPARLAEKAASQPPRT